MRARQPKRYAPRATAIIVIPGPGDQMLPGPRPPDVSVHARRATGSHAGPSARCPCQWVVARRLPTCRDVAEDMSWPARPPLAHASHPRAAVAAAAIEGGGRRRVRAGGGGHCAAKRSDQPSPVGSQRASERRRPRSITLTQTPVGCEEHMAS